MKGYKFYDALGALKKYGFNNSTFITCSGEEKSYKELFRNPPVADPKSPEYIPHADGTIWTISGDLIIKPEESI